MRKKALNILVLLVIIFVAGFILLKTIQPSGSFTLEGDINLATIRIYIKGKQLKPELLQQRTFKYKGLPGSVQIKITGPLVQTIEDTLSIKPLIGGHKNIHISPAPTAEIIATKKLSSIEEIKIVEAKVFESVWMGVAAEKSESSFMYALHYDYDKGDWIVLNPSSLLDTSLPAVKGAPPDFLQYVTDTAAD